MLLFCAPYETKSLNVSSSESGASSSFSAPRWPNSKSGCLLLLLESSSSGADESGGGGGGMLSLPGIFCACSSQATDITCSILERQSRTTALSLSSGTNCSYHSRYQCATFFSTHVGDLTHPRTIASILGKKKSMSILFVAPIGIWLTQFW